MPYVNGILFVAENTSPALHKVSEIYDRIGFAAVGKYNEFENLRVAGIQHADLRGYSYDRRDVTARSLANAYAQTLGAIFTEQQKPYEVELCVAEVGFTVESDQVYRLTYDGTIVDEPEFLVMGGQAEALTAAMRESYREGESWPTLSHRHPGPSAQSAVTPVPRASSPRRSWKWRSWTAPGRARAFRRVLGAALTQLLPAAPQAEPVAAEDAARSGHPGRGRTGRRNPEVAESEKPKPEDGTVEPP
jgi:proteasome alpha subunit